MPRWLQLSCAEDYTAFLDKVRIDGQLCLFKERPGISGPSLGGVSERMRILTRYNTPYWSKVSKERFIVDIHYVGFFHRLNHYCHYCYPVMTMLR